MLYQSLEDTESFQSAVHSESPIDIAYDRVNDDSRADIVPLTSESDEHRITLPPSNDTLKHKHEVSLMTRTQEKVITKKKKNKFVPLAMFGTNQEMTAPQTKISTTTIVGSVSSSASASNVASPWKIPAPDMAPPPTMSEFMATTRVQDKSPRPHRQLPSTTHNYSPVLQGESFISSGSMASVPAAGASSISGLTLEDFMCPARKQVRQRGKKNPPTDLAGESQATSRDLSTPVKSRSGSCPWTTSPSTACSSADRGGTLRLSDIQQEEEIERQQSRLKELRGHNSPWLMDRRSARVESLKNVMSVQQQENDRARLEAKEVAEAIAAVEKLTRLEEMEGGGKKRISSGQQSRKRNSRFKK